METSQQDILGNNPIESVTRVSVEETPALARGGKVVLIALAVQQLVMAYDSTAMNVAVSEIVGDLNTTLTGVQSAISLYALVMAALMITGSELGSRRGPRRMFVLGAVIYGIGALVTAVSQTLGQMVFGWSLLEGIGAALVFPNILAIISASFQGKARMQAITMVGAAAGVGAALGPIVGGFITVAATWRLSFLMEVVVTAVVAVLVLRRLTSGPKKGMAGFDFAGASLSALGMALVVLGFLLASSYGILWARTDVVVAGRTVIAQGGLSPTIWLVVIGLSVLAGFIFWERRLVKSGKDPLVRPDVFNLRIPRIGSIALAFQYMFTAGLLFVVPVFLQTTLGYDALQSGVTLLPATVALVIGAVVASRLVARERVRREQLVIVSFVLMATGAILVALTFDADSAARNFVIPLAIAGLGMGAAVVLQDLVQSSVPADQASDVAGVSRSSAYLGQSIGVALVGAVMVTVLIGAFSAQIQASPDLTVEQKQQIDTRFAAEVEVTAVSDAQVEAALESAGLPPAIVEQVVRMNAIARESALTASVLILAASAVIGFLVSLGLRRHTAQPAPA